MRRGTHTSAERAQPPNYFASCNALPPVEPDFWLPSWVRGAFDRTQPLYENFVEAHPIRLMGKV